MANEPKMSFDELPKENTGGGNVEPGPNHMKIMSATKELSAKGKPMLVLKVAPVQAEKLQIFDRYTLFDENYKPESFGQYKLKKLLDAVDYKPKGNFSIEMLVEALPGFEFMVDLEHEEGTNGKTYLGIKNVESYRPVGDITEEEEVSPESFMEKENSTTGEPSDKIKAALEDDDDVV